jgi:hypothetical protein
LQCSNASCSGYDSLTKQKYYGRSDAGDINQSLTTLSTGTVGVAPSSSLLFYEYT